jgi:hypothetical protein
VTPMHKYAAVTAFAIALITINAPAVSALGFPQHEVDCDGWARGLRRYAIRCHCSFECNRQYPGYTVTVPCLHRTPAFCDLTAWPLDAIHACITTCATAKGVAQPRP